MDSFTFSKMHGAGNDFVLLNDKNTPKDYPPAFIRALCDRRRGIGADGVIVLSQEQKQPVHSCANADGTDESSSKPPCIRMDFYNCDGSRAEMCGNGLRCAAAFAYKYALSREPKIRFRTPGGILNAEILSSILVKIEILLNEPFCFYENIAGYRVGKGKTGVPHCVVPLSDPETADVERLGAAIRRDPAFAPEGSNVDFIPEHPDFSRPIPIRTYERGVEGETLACGTGIAAAGLFLAASDKKIKKLSFLSRSGDVLEVEIIKECNMLKGVHLTGPAIEVFRGESEYFQ